MKTILTLSIIFILSLSGCGDSKKNTTNENTGASGTNTQTPQQQNNPPGQKENTNQSTQNNAGGIRVQFPVGSTQVTLNGNIKGLEDNITYVFEVRQGQKLTASVKPAKGQGNIRFNQIFDPSGNADGPFGNQMTYNLNQSGDWKLVVGESNMLGEPFVGEYMLTIEIK